MQARQQPNDASRPGLRIVARDTDPAPLLSISRQWLAFCIATALLFGSLVRASFVLAADFPLNDGGMFYTMATELQANGYRLPELTSYNFDGIPFAYPPFALYVAATIEDLTPLSMVDVFRFQPLAVTIGILLAFTLLARRMLSKDVAFVASVAAFAFIPFSYEWMIMGGGITRSLGLLFAVLALCEVHRMYTSRNSWCIVTVGLLAGLCALSHLEMASFFAFSTALFFAAYGRSWASARATAGAAAIAFAVTAPWWISMFAYHGFDPFLAAVTTGSPGPVNPLLTFLVFQPTDEPLFAIIAAMALLGIAWSLANGRWMLPAWVLACGLLDPRGFGNVASVPIALLAGVAVAEVLLPILVRPATAKRRRWVLPSVVFGFLIAYALIGALVATPSLLTPVESDEREAMGWISRNTPSDAAFLVVTDQSWPVDRSSEWFPVLAERRSVATVQGTEWIRGRFADNLESYRDLQLCADGPSSCIDDWRTAYDVDYDYIYVPKTAELQLGVVDHPDECCAALRFSLRDDERYSVVFDGEGATVFRLGE